MRATATSAPRVLSSKGITAVCIGVGVAAGAATVGAGFLGGTTALAHPVTFAILTVLLVYTHLRPTRLVHRHGSVESDHLDEALLPPMILMLSPFDVAVAVVVATVAGNLAARRAPIKLVFNVGQTVLASLAGFAVAGLIAPDTSAPVTAAAILACGVGALVFTMVSSVAVAGIVRLAVGEPVLAGLWDQWRTRGLASFGSLLLGVVAGVVVRDHPEAVVPAIALGWTIEAAYVAVVVQRQGRLAAEALQQGVVAVRSSGDPDAVRDHLLATAKEVLHAGAAAFVPAREPKVSGELRVSLDEETDLRVTDRIGGGSWIDTERDALTTLANVGAEALRNAHLLAHLTAITDGQSEGVLAVDSAGVITFANPAACALLGQDVDLVGRDADAVLSIERASGALSLTELSGAEESVRDDDAVLRVADRQVPVALTAAGLPAPQTGVVLVLHDITERKAFEKKLSYLAFHDPLTDLPNRRLFQDRVEHALVRAKRHNTRHALLMFDLDRFKLINDSYGHPIGDDLLVHVASLLRRNIRPEDTCARLGGDEFAIFLEDIADAQQAVTVAERILADVAEGSVIGGHEVFVSASIGIATTDHADSLEALVAAADSATYAAKAAGKGTFRLFAAATAEDPRARLELETALRRALDDGEFELYYQPVVDTVTNETVGAEALVRWNSADGVVTPLNFIHIAEETGLIIRLDAWVLEEACRQTRQWTLDHPERPPLKINVNLSALQFSRSAIAIEVADILRRTQLPPDQLCLEITETGMMTDTELTIMTLQDLKALGVRVAIDDFGTGYSSLSYLKRFPVDIVKIDRAFTAGLGVNVVDSEILAAVVRLAAACEITVVAEGVETVEQRRALIELGCPLIQGYLIARPQPAARFAEAWLAQPIVHRQSA
ncbi:putative bifunctional diguanylate cyclase/phosphodiesterase [Nocardioides pelophilus]|uniref:putative bifunctional diguanylate cyclase/phosphodiesterase n=1 Tax=Nocardioides pelophilus TaxID=2172019 RepID=UPI001601694B|nr:EAL domain-containing protein [Nocardioides pelophilus]